MPFSLDDEFALDPIPKRKWSLHQEDVFEAVRRPNENILIQAVAGSGKSTTLEAAVDHSPGSTLIMAFNKSIAEEMKSRVHCDVKTLNALGWRLLKDNLPSSQLNAKKTSEILRSLLNESDQTEFGFSLDKIIGLAKNNAFGISPNGSGTVFPVPQEDFESLIDSSSDIPCELIPKFADICSRALFQASSDLITHDFNDQLYIPLLKGWTYPRYSSVFIDECQDLSPVQHLMLEEFRSEGSRIVAVGDRHQAIYGFRGALTDSMDQLKRRFEMTELPLSISYRCAQFVIAEAQRFCPHIQARDGAPLGTVSNAQEDPHLFPNGNLIICRNNAPLFRAILRHVRERSPCRVLSNFLESLSGFIRSFKCKESKDLQTKLDNWQRKEIEAAERRGFKGKIAGIEDKYETLSLFCKEYKNVQDILDLLKKLSTGTSGPIFSTIHKAKGLEADSVYLLRPDLLPSPWCTSPEQLQQEANLEYVAITRARLNLTYGAAKS